ncbi:hypothetical protein BWQ93_03290 [Sphingopyxis sp. QXT-31]|uniref:DGQHR domain-containing protein n=1 Tax=Sphingopyxis sp. QXT-31 TaxID=1357916 RepID=UPI0009797DF3|nr:DNA sulfur modification protein DndB [Sphingopyxis sp. QXT-31]APZ97618.1 hypothetical protein BWQ93_03290 [Sphingopyxis sp. QXT-31]
MSAEYFPALRGRFGDWAFYSVLMTLAQIAGKVNFADEIHSSERLSEMIQRELKKGRGTQIADYLKDNDDRFFNSLVIAVYKGDPEWLALGDVKPRDTGLDPAKLSDTAAYSLGFLRLSGDEDLFALDGQHRLAGIKAALEEDASLGEDEVSVLFVAHHGTAQGLKRTRKLFTTLNKTAKAVKKSEIIALDESDVMAIITRRLVEEHPSFCGDQILFSGRANLPGNDLEHLTTIENLYDVLTVLFWKVRSKESLERLRFYRPPDDILDLYYDWTGDLFRKIGATFPPFGTYLKSGDKKEIAAQRTDAGGHLLFRPVGLMILAELLAALVPTEGIEGALKLIAKLPMDLSQPPHKGIIWNPSTRTMEPANKATSRNILLYMLGKLKPAMLPRLTLRYAELLGQDPAKTVLPAPIKAD